VTARRPGCSDPGEGEVDGRAFAGRCADDRHHFRFIVSPDDAVEMSDLKSFTRDLVGQMERDLGTAG
jgi:type IV secretory pathway VirD2 relaxase